MLPMQAIVTEGNGNWCAYTFLGQWQRLEIIVDKYVASILQRHGIRAALVVFDFRQGDGCSCVATV